MPTWITSLIISSITFTGSVIAQAGTNATTQLPSNLANLPGFDSTNNLTTASNHSLAGYNTTDSNTTTTHSNPGANLRIPTTISQSCQDFLGHLNSNPNITSCTAPLLNATASFASGPKSVTRDQVKKAFDGLCGSNSGSGCAPHMMYTILNQFSSACNLELQTGVEAVRMAYDVLYILTPYRVALCSKDPTTGDYCPSVIAAAVVNGTASPASGKSANSSASDFGAMVSSVFGDKLVTQLGGSSGPHPSLHTRDTVPQNSSGSNPSPGTSQQQVFNPNPDTYTNTNLAFLFLSAYLPDAALCKPCTQSVLAAYIGFEQATPHFGGLSSSGYLSGQLKLWQAVSARCGAPFIEAINQEAGIMSILTTSAAAAFNLLLKNSSSFALAALLFISIKSLNLF
ncbi:hypothetical protein PGT21_033398 [Puccinia graminis f. sp. tritici]|uniref:DUF7729 domain-containing protein n=3 Tax=Puccinia graminis f. sp. tritici TaxID=56615 RepID=E3KWT4_PUCGT|nr:uncharacterized protein PGTG_14717 [Puccinia graminis f. sp. tritici CRL 75-36-700-3]EFP88751.1 hypothetical protein PGTG_14717 [Puccinia graminis f. sp. tritici CRL 75-36-700-3]KAA1075256.1 hypothetical protein PGT21_032257 [Puccinia graminis f. sp. tritici]KAA1081303.1 hypothetical protein PGT21_033398 [Puccinia graminis f. sp. tritici]